jgi:hypothetical protein
MFGYELFTNSISGVALRSVALGRDASEEAGLGLGRTKMEKGGGERRGRMGQTRIPARFRLVNE